MAHAGLRLASLTYVSGELRLGATASHEAHKKLLEALNLLQIEIHPPRIRPGCTDLPIWRKPDNQEGFHYKTNPIGYHREHSSMGLPVV